ncbi:MAG TPA: DNA polymerase III subunit alpha [Actinomycetota bacterium]|nr:DNA polymerase III subunit alpha [Actinomycetota bacterium]
MAGGSFVHLHTHSEFSLLDGAARITALFERAAANHMPALALTDHGAMYGALQFYEAGTAAGVKPILGVEAYVAPSSRFDRSPGESEEKYRHLTILARNGTGYRNLLKLVTDAYLEGFYHRPRIDKQVLAEHGNGLIGLSGCLASEVSQLLLNGQEKKATEIAAEYRDIFGAGNFYVELQDHGLEDQARILPGLVQVAEWADLPIVATNDLHYTDQGDAKPHDVLLCIQQQKVQTDMNRLKFDSDEFYLKSAEEMREVFREFPQACDATLEIAEMCELELVYGNAAPEDERFHVPRFEPPQDKDRDTYLRELVLEGAATRYPELTPEIRARIDHELGVINSMGFSAYFLIVWDLIRFARENGIRVGPGRGSAAGSVVSYSLRITDLDPLRYGLIFERFLNPGRIQMPDIDMDFDERRRDEVIRYVADKYGSDHVAQIITFQTIKGKQGIRDAARVLGFPASVGDRLCKMYPPAIMGRDEPIERALQISHELRDAYEREPEAREIVDTARALEGLRREDSVHAAGVVIGDEPLVNYLPLKLSKDSRDDSRRIVTQFDMKAVEDLGLLKMDFLGLRTLSVIEDTLSHLRRRDVELDIDHVPLDDEPVYDMLRRADTTGVFQLEGGGMRSLIKHLAPDRFEDLMALVALYRPGPLNAGMHVEYAERKHGRRQVTYPHEDLEDILSGTYGIMVYQEQVMQIAVRISGYSMAEADTLRHAMGKKIRAKLMVHREKFIEGCVANGYPSRLGEDLFELMEPFADYGFNASHACAYGYVAYQTAYLKAHHPVEYMSAVLTSVRDDKDRKPFYLNACRLMGLEVLPPDVNESEQDFAPVASGEPKIRYGLSAVRNVGAGAVQQVISARRAKGAFTGYADFCRKVDPSVLTKKVLESLIYAGAFDSLGYRRRGLVENQEKISGPIAAERKAEAAGQFSLFGGGEQAAHEIDEAVITPEEFEKRTLLRLEKEMLGQFVTDHPLLEVRERLAALSDMELSEAETLGDGDLVTVAGIVSSIARRYSKKGEPYAQFRLEDLAGGITVVVFPGQYDSVQHLLEPDAILLVKGRADRRGRGEELQLRAVEITEPDLGGPGRQTEPEGVLQVDVAAASCTKAVIGKLKELLAAHPGRTPVRVRFLSSQGVRPLEVGTFQVEPGAGMLSELRLLLGQDAARVVPNGGVTRLPEAGALPASSPA